LSALSLINENFDEVLGLLLILNRSESTCLSRLTTTILNLT